MEMEQIFQLLKEGNIDALNYQFDLDGVATDIEYIVPNEVFIGLNDNFKIIPFIPHNYNLGLTPSVEFHYNARKFKIIQEPIHSQK